MKNWKSVCVEHNRGKFLYALRFSNFAYIEEKFHFQKSILFNFFKGEPEESADIKIDDDMVFFLSKRVVTNWKRFARNLELRDEEIDEIEETQESFGDKFIAVITKFNADGGNLKWIQTKAVLEEIGLTKVMLEFKNEYLKNRPAVNLPPVN